MPRHRIHGPGRDEPLAREVRMGEGTRLSPLFSWRGCIGDSDLPATTRHVALQLSMHMNERGGSAFPSVATLARETRLSEHTVRDHLHDLRDAGWLSVTERGGPYKTNIYAATVPESFQIAHATSRWVQTGHGQPASAGGQPPSGRPATSPRQGRTEDVIRSRGSLLSWEGLTSTLDVVPRCARCEDRGVLDGGLDDDGRQVVLRCECAA